MDLTFWNFLLKSFYTPQLKWYLISRINVYEKLHKSPNNLILWLLCHSRGQNSFTSIGEIPKPHERKLRAIRYHWLHHHDALPAHIPCASQDMRAYNTQPTPLKNILDIYYWPQPVKGAFMVSSKRTRNTEQGLFWNDVNWNREYISVTP